MLFVHKQKDIADATTYLRFLSYSGFGAEAGLPFYPLLFLFLLQQCHNSHFASTTPPSLSFHIYYYLRLSAGLRHATTL